MSVASTGATSAAVTVAPSIDTAAFEPEIPVAEPSRVTVTVNALLAGVEAVSRVLSKVTASAVPFTVALTNCGGG